MAPMVGMIAGKWLIFRTGRNGTPQGGTGGNALQNRCTATVLTRQLNNLHKRYSHRMLSPEIGLAVAFASDRRCSHSAALIIAKRRKCSSFS
jgi:hypothetical protein